MEKDFDSKIRLRQTENVLKKIIETCNKPDVSKDDIMDILEAFHKALKEKNDECLGLELEYDK